MMSEEEAQLESEIGVIQEERKRIQEERKRIASVRRRVALWTELLKVALKIAQDPDRTAQECEALRLIGEMALALPPDKKEENARHRDN